MSVDFELGQSILKPAGGLMDALMSPKIVKVRQWANERDLRGQLQPEQLEQLMRSYLDGLAKRVSEITSMAFPHEKLDIFKVYEPLYLKKYQGSEPVDIIEKLRTGQLNVTIIDDAGMGKSTYSKHLVTELLGKSEYIPILYDLRKIKAGDELVEVLAKELDAPGALISRDVFYRLLQLGKFVLILDGFDEVSLSLQSEVADQINQLSYKASENSIVLTTRPQSGLPDLVGGKTVEFLELTRKQAESLIRRYDTVRGGEVGEKLIEQLHTVPEEFLKTPLLVTLMYQTFLTKGYIATDVSRFYNSVFDALYDGHDLQNKNYFEREKSQS